MALEPLAATTDLTTKYRYLRAFSFAENAADPGAEARIIIRDSSAAGAIMLDIRLTAKESKHMSYARPLLFPGGMHVTISGSARGSIDAD